MFLDPCQAQGIQGYMGRDAVQAAKVEAGQVEVTWGRHSEPVRATTMDVHGCEMKPVHEGHLRGGLDPVDPLQIGVLVIEARQKGFGYVPDGERP